MNLYLLVGTQKERPQMGGMVFPGCAMTVVGGRCILKLNTCWSWFDLTRFYTTVMVCKQE